MKGWQKKECRYEGCTNIVMTNVTASILCSECKVISRREYYRVKYQKQVKMRDKAKITNPTGKIPEKFLVRGNISTSNYSSQIDGA